MSNLAYLGAAFLLSAIGCLILWVRNRKPHSMEAHIQDFARELKAMAPDSTPPRRRRSG